MKHITSAFLLILCSVLIAGCNTNPVELRDEIRKAKSITIICCDNTAAASITGTSMMILGGTGALGLSSTKGANDERTKKFYETAGGPPLMLPSMFLAELQESLKQQGYAVTTEYPHSFDGYNNRYIFDTSKVKSQLLLEVRYVGQIGEYQSRYFPTLAATFTVKRSVDNKSLNTGIVATSDPGITSPLVLGVEMLRAPILSTLIPGGAVKYARLVNLDESQVVKGSDADLMASAKRIYAGTERANRDMAKLLTSRIAESMFN
ncbi:MAG: hypothetical protein EAZ30_09905 [Betaproteobacteria bacterium]|nr:MAG: hypothetical protein EAZ30_09905 [Betaproteobacteria bacterium]